MEKKWLALVAASAIASAVFVGCSCGNKVDNSMDDMNQIEVQSDVTFSSAETAQTTAATVSSANKSTTVSGVTSSVSEGETSSKVSREIQFAGQSQANKTTVKPVVVTKVVVVTVTRAPAATTVPPVITTATPEITTIETTETTETTAAATTTTSLVTLLMPDGMFHGDADLNLSVETIEMSIGNTMPDLGEAVVSKTETTAVNGGVSAYVYSCDGFTVTSDVYANEDGSVQELIREIVLTGSGVCTGKGITIGSSTDDIIAAYGTEGLEVTDTFNYKYKTEDGRVLDICTDGSAVREIKYYTEVQ